MSTVPKILVVDDETVNRKTLEWMLREEGFEVMAAGTGREARVLAARHGPDLILLDILMPGESGFETCERLLADSATADIPIIFISGLGDSENRIRGLRLGAVDYVAKPFAKEEVALRVKLHIRLRQANRALIEEQAKKLRQISEAQKAILVSPGELPEARFAVRYIPALEAGGDFYDVYQVTDAVWGYFVADISGHDLGASFVTSSLKALLRQNSGPLFSPLETLKNINAVLATILRDGMHLTASLLTVNRVRGRISLVTAGHPPPLWVGADGGVGFLESEGDVLGVFPSVHLGVIERRMTAGDRVYLYTDGLIEGDGPGGAARREGRERLALMAQAVRERPLDAAVAGMVRELTGTDDKGDDIVLVGVEI